MNIHARHVATAVAMALLLLTAPVVAQKSESKTGVQSSERTVPPPPPPVTDRAADAIDRARDGLPPVTPPPIDSEAPMATPPPVPGAAHAPSVMQRDRWTQLDSDGDGRISTVEGSADIDFRTHFASMDANGDGFVSDGEYRAHVKTPNDPGRKEN